MNKVSKPLTVFFRYLSVICILALSIFLILQPVDTIAFETYQEASFVLGQTDPNAADGVNAGGLGANSLTQAYGVIVVGNKLIASDYSNHRVLIWNSIPTTNKEAADVVIGQPNMTSNTANNGGIGADTLNHPAHLASNGTNLIIADADNNRVLVFNTIPTTDGASADLVIGQDNFTTSTCASQTATRFCRPWSVAYDGETDTLAIGTYSFSVNNRVVLFNDGIPTTNGAAASIAVDESSLTSVANQCGSPADATCISSGVAALAIYEGKLFAGGYTDSRVLVWNTIPTENLTPADYVYGQPDFTTLTYDFDASARTLAYTAGILYDSTRDRLFINDADNRRVVIHDGIPEENYPAASVAIGAPSLTTTLTINTAGSRYVMPWYSQIAYHEETGYLFVPDVINARSRISVFEDSRPTVSNIQTSTYLTSATITWDSSVTGSSIVRYGTTPEFSSKARIDNNLSSHRVTLSSLQSCTTYYFQTQVKDSNLSTGISGTYAFTTECAPGESVFQGSFATCTALRPNQSPNLFLMTQQDDQVTLYFAPVTDNQTGYFVSYGPTDNPDQYHAIFDYQDKSGVLISTIDDLTPGLEFVFKVRASNGCSAGPWSQVLTSEPVSL